MSIIRSLKQENLYQLQLHLHTLVHPQDLPDDFQVALQIDPVEIVVKDFIAGMTDEYAFRFVEEVCQ